MHCGNYASSLTSHSTLCPPLLSCPAGLCSVGHTCPVLLLSQACTRTPKPNPHFLSKPLWTPISKSCLYLPQLMFLSFLSTIFDHPHAMVVPYFLTLDCITITIFLYNICLMISCEFLPQRPLRVMNMPDAFFWICQSKYCCTRCSENTRGSEYRNSISLLSYYAFLYVVSLEGRRDIRLEKQICMEGKIRT